MRAQSTFAFFVAAARKVLRSLCPPVLTALLRGHSPLGQHLCVVWPKAPRFVVLPSVSRAGTVLFGCV
jgi:hypothetical protein